MEMLVKFNNKVKLVEEFLLSLCIILMAAILVANVLGRFCFNRGLTFAEEVSSILTVVITFVGVSYCARVGRHILMSALFDAVNNKGKKIFVFISSIITAIAMLYLTYASAMYVLKIFTTGRYTSALQIPLWIPYLIIPLGFLFAGLQYALIFYFNLRDDAVHTCLDPIPEESADPNALPMDSTPDTDEPHTDNHDDTV